MESFILIFIAFCAPVGGIALLIGCIAPLFSGNWRRRARLYRLWGALGIAEFVLALLWVIDVYGSDGIDSGARFFVVLGCWLPVLAAVQTARICGVTVRQAVLADRSDGHAFERPE